VRARSLVRVERVPTKHSEWLRGDTFRCAVLLAVLCSGNPRCDVLRHAVMVL
jgi:hypothetical protein